MQSMNKHSLAETAEEMHPLGARDTKQAVDDAIKKGREAEPY